MDPLSILGAVSTAIETTYKISSTLFNFIQSSRIIDKTLEELNCEVEGLTKALKTVELSLKDPAVSRIKSGEDRKGPWGSLDIAVTDTQRTVNALKSIVEGLGMVKKSANPFKKGLKQVKFHLDADQISKVKDRIHTHTTSLQLALQTASLLISCQSSEGIQTVERLIKAMHLNVESSRKDATDERLPSRFRNPELLKHTEQLISSASTVLGSKSTASGGSEMRFPHSSENGQPLDRRQREAIEDWIPHLASMEEQPPQTSNHHDKSATSDALIGTDGFNIEEVQSTESDSDDDYDIAKKCFESAKKDFSSDQHAKALEFFRAGIKRAKELGLKKKARLDLRTIQMEMGLSLLSLGELGESEQRLLSVARAQTKDEKGARLALHASSGLAQICLCKRAFAEADEWCRKSRIGWKRVGGRGHPAHVACLRLSAFSCELQGDHTEAVLFEEMADESKAAPAAVDTELNAYESLGFTIERSRILVTEYHKKVPDTTRIEMSTKSRRLSPANQPGSNPIDLPMAQTLAESPIKPKSGTTAAGSLHDAARKGDTGLINRLLENGADIEETAGEDFSRPLHLAALHGNTSAVKCLLDRGANIEAKKVYGNTALLVVAWSGHKSMLVFLLDRGANIEAKNQNGSTALLRAAYEGHKSIVECLLDRGANIEAINVDSITALSLAAWAGHKSIVECLLDRGAIIDATNPLGETTLLLMCRMINEEENKSEFVSTIELLCSKRADVSVKDYEGNSPLGYARKVENSNIRKELVRVLRQYGAKD